MADTIYPTTPPEYIRAWVEAEAQSLAANQRATEAQNLVIFLSEEAHLAQERLRKASRHAEQVDVLALRAAESRRETS